MSTFEILLRIQKANVALPCPETPCRQRGILGGTAYNGRYGLLMHQVKNLTNIIQPVEPKLQNTSDSPWTVGIFKISLPNFNSWDSVVILQNELGEGRVRFLEKNLLPPLPMNR